MNMKEPSPLPYERKMEFCHLDVNQPPPVPPAKAGTTYFPRTANLPYVVPSSDGGTFASPHLQNFHSTLRQHILPAKAGTPYSKSITPAVHNHPGDHTNAKHQRERPVRIVANEPVRGS